MRVSRRRLTIGQNPNKIDAVILDPCMIAETPGIAFALSLPKRLGIAGCVALRCIGWPEYLRSTCHGRLLVGSAYATSLADRHFQFQVSNSSSRESAAWIEEIAGFVLAIETYEKAGSKLPFLQL